MSAGELLVVCHSLGRRSGTWAAFVLLTAAAFMAPLSDVAANANVPVLLRTIHVAANPQRIAVNPDTSRLYIANFNGDLQVIDTDSDTVVKTFEAINAWWPAVNRTTNRVYVAQWSRRQVAVVDGATNAILAEIDVATHPTNVAVNPVTNRVYVNSEDEEIFVIDGDTNEIIDRISVGASYIAVNPTTNTIYATSLLQGTLPIPTQLTAIDGATNEKKAEIEIGPLAFGLEVDPANGMIVAITAIDLGPGPGQLWMVDAKSFSVLKSVPMTEQISTVGIDARTHEIYAVNFYSSTVAVFDSSGTEVGTAEVGVVGAGPTGIAVDEVRNVAYVSVVNAGEIAVVGRSTPGALPVNGGPPGAHSRNKGVLVAGLALLALGGVAMLAAHRRRSTPAV